MLCLALRLLFGLCLLLGLLLCYLLLIFQTLLLLLRIGNGVTGSGGVAVTASDAERHQKRSANDGAIHDDFLQTKIFLVMA